MSDEPETMIQVPGNLPATQKQAEEAWAHGNEVLVSLGPLVVESQEDLELVSELLRDVKAKAKALDVERKKVTVPLNAVVKQVNGWFKPAINKLEACEKVLKKKASDAMDREAKKKQEALEQVRTAETAEQVELFMGRARGTGFTPVEGLQTRQSWGYTVEDFDKIPREFLLVDDQALKAYVREHKEDAHVQGIRFECATSVASITASGK